MSFESHPDPSKIIHQPATSQLSVEAACFIPTNFEQSVASTSEEVPSYYGGYVWPRNEMKDASSYLRSLGQWPLGHPYGSPGIPPPFHYGQYPPPHPIDYWPATLRNGNLAGSVSPGGRPPDAFNSPYTDIPWNSLPLQEPNALASLPGVSARRPKSSRAKDPSRTNPGMLYSPAASKDPDFSPSAVPSEGGEPVRTKKKKRKSRSSIIRIRVSEAGQSIGSLASVEAGADVLSKNTVQGNSVGEKDGSMHGSTSFIPDDSPSLMTGSKAYKNNDAQTDFSEDLSRLTLLEKPSSLYDQSSSPDFLKSYSFMGSSSATTPNSTGTMPTKPLLWTSIVSRTAVPPVGKTTASSETNVPLNTNFRSKAEHSVNRKDVKKSAFDHSSTRSQSGKRKSTGISTSDQKQDPSSSNRTKHEYSAGKHEYSAGKHEYSSGKNEYSAGKQRDSLGKVETTVSGKNVKGETGSLTKTKREVFVDGKRIESAADGRSQRFLKNVNNDFSSDKARSQRENNGSEVFSVKRVEEDWTPSEEQYEEGKSRSPSWRRVQTIGSSSSQSKTAETSELPRSASNGRAPSTGGKSSLRNKPGVETDKRQQSKSRKTSLLLLQGNSSKQGVTTSAGKSEEKSEGGTAKRRRKNRKKKTSATEDGGIGEKGPAAEMSASSLSVGPSILMQFDDDDEFPGLLQAAQTSTPNEVSSGPIKYSDILSGRAKTPIRNYASNRQKTSTKENRPDISAAAGDESDWDLDIGTSEKKESLQKTPQKTTSASRSISQPPKSTPKPMQEKRAVGAGAKTKEPITLSLFDMITVKSKNKKTPEKDDEKKPLKTGTKSEKKSKSGNVLDSSGVQMRRGKEREVPKAKKPSLLRKVILKERESRRQKFLRGCMTTNGEEEEDEAGSSDFTEDACDDGLRRHASAPMRTSVPRVASVSPSTARDASLPQDEPPAAAEAKDSHKEMLQSMIHSRRFREYCTQVLSKEIDDCCMLLLQELVRFQDRLYHKDPNKARLKRRIVLGLREVTKHLKARRIKCVIISPNLERIQSKGGLDEALHVIIETCQSQNIPFMFALSRKQLGKACCKVVPVSVVGIFSYEGAEEHFKKLKDLTEKARESYEEMVSNAAAEMEEFRKLYPEENWIIDGNVCDEKKTSENMQTPSPCVDFANADITDGKTCPVSSCNTPVDAQDQFSPVDLVNVAQHPTEGKDDSFTNSFDSDLESWVADRLIAETGSVQSLETGQVRENGGHALEASNDVSDSICSSGSEFIHVNTQSS